mgnify:FL=1
MKADKTKITRLLKTARGQLDGIINMVEDDRYCIDISNQILAAQAILTKVNKEILHAHMEHCVNQSLGNADSDKKIEEILAVMDKMMK